MGVNTKKIEKEIRINKNSSLSKYGTVFALLAVIVIFSVISDRFMAPDNLINILRQISTLTIVAVGLTICMATNDFDLSVGNVAGLAGVLTTGLLVTQHSMLFSIAAGLSVGVIAGLINSFLITFIGIGSMIATLGTSSIILGINFGYTGGRAVYGGLPDFFYFFGRGSLFGIPTPIIIMAIVLITAYFLLNRTVFGRYVYAVGGNINAARLSGIRVRYYRSIAIIISGITAALAGIVLASRLGSGQPTAGQAFLMDGLGAVFIGMTTIKPGQPNILGTMVGAFIIGVINNGLNLLGLPFWVQDIGKGVIMILAVASAVYRNQK
ncbi:MAG TPA: ABC transporter permease [Thermoanaerobacterales bacterium]|nr:ABC transporter permease [Thermoanaerobacterales bacterium]